MSTKQKVINTLTALGTISSAGYVAYAAFNHQSVRDMLTDGAIGMVIGGGAATGIMLLNSYANDTELSFDDLSLFINSVTVAGITAVLMHHYVSSDLTNLIADNTVGG